jgi:ribonuclease HI
MKLTIYTDGSSRGNPGPGGWAAIIITDTEVIELGGAEQHTTNNRMELLGAIKGLEVVSSKQYVVRSESNDPLPTTNYQLVTSVEVFTDSEYVKKGMSVWITGWIAKGWKTSTKKPVLNQDLWEELHAEEKRLKDAGVVVTWTYVKAHVGIALNERADTIATSCSDSVVENTASNLQLYRGPKSEYAFM